MTATTQAQSFGDIRIEGQGNQLVINQTVQISARDVLSQTFRPASPYRGLEAFDDKHSHLFFGRGALLADLLKAVSQHPLLMVAGASGSGKSSVVRAGLLPQLAQRVEGFRSFKMKPGSDPFASLKYGLVSGGLDERDVEFATAGQPDTLAQVTALRPAGECWLLFIDQFEELFTLCDRADRRDAFVEGLLSVSVNGQAEFRIVLTMRLDFFDRFDSYPELLQQIRRALQFVTSPTPAELRQCIEQPAAQHGVVFEEGLVNQILTDIKGQPGTLPLLQDTLRQLWLRDNPVDDRTLNKSSYVAIGGVGGSLRQRADAVYARKKKQSRSEAEQQTMRRVFLRLVEVSGQGTSAPIVSRRRPLACFSASEQAIVRELIEEKLLVSSLEEKAVQGGAFDQGTAELAHESLLFAWPTLTEWLNEAREVLFIRNRLSHDAQQWQRLRRQSPGDASGADEELWSGTRLSNALELRARGDFHTVLGALSAEEEAFLDASETRKVRRDQEEKERLHREREVAEKNRQLLLDSYIERGQRLLFEKSEPYPAALWLHRAYQGGSKNLTLPDLLKSAMQWVEATKRVLSGHRHQVNSVVHSPDGRCLLTASHDQTARVWDAHTGKLLLELTGHKGPVWRARYSPDGRRIVTASFDHEVRLFDAEAGRLLAVLTGHKGAVQVARFSPDGSRILTASDDQTARVFDVERGQLQLELIGHQSPIVCARYSPDGRRIVTAGEDHTARVFDAESGRCLVELVGHADQIRSAQYSPDGRHIVTASWDRTARVFGTEDGQPVAVLQAHKDALWNAQYSPDGRRIVTASADKTACVFDAGDGRLLDTLKGHQGWVDSARYSPDGRHIFTASMDDTIRIWDAESGYLLTECKGHGKRILRATYSADSQHVVTTSQDNTARVFATKCSRLLAELKGPQCEVASAEYSPDGRRIVTASKDDTARIWDAEDGRLLVELSPHGSYVESATYSFDGSRILTAESTMARVFDAEDGRLLLEMSINDAPLLRARYSPDGRRIILETRNHTARIFDAESGQLLAENDGSPLHGAEFSRDGQRAVTIYGGRTSYLFHGERLLAELNSDPGPFQNATISRDGQRIATASWNGTVCIWDGERGLLLARLAGKGSAAAFSPDGRRIVTASAAGLDKTARIWDTESGQLLAELTGHDQRVVHAAFSPDGRRIVTSSADRTARIWDVTPEIRTPEEIARILRARSCVRFEPEDGNVLVPCTPPPVEI